jgi:hypothetical protein
MYIQKEQAQVRNEELFPFIKRRAIIEDGTNKLLLTQENAIAFVNLLKKIVPQIGPFGGPQLSHKFKKWFVRRLRGNA